MQRRKFSALVATLVGSLWSAGGMAQVPPYPSKPIRLVVGFAPGGNTDVVARLVAARVGTELGRPITIENKSGAAGNLASEAVARATPDGYTLIAGNLTTHVLSIGLYKLRFDVEKDFAPIALIGRTPVLLAVSNAAGASDLPSFVKLLKDKPGKLNYASAGNGGLGHLSAVMFNNAVGAQAQHVPYAGGAAALADLIEGRVDYLFDGLSTLGPYAAAGKLKILATAASKRDPKLPAVPTFAEAGMPGMELATWNAWFAPAATPPEVVAQINAAVGKALQDPALATSLTKVGNEVAPPMPLAAVAEFVHNERKKWLPVVKASGVKLD